MAGFFDTLFGGGAEKEAAEKDKQALAAYQQQGLGALGQGYGTGTEALNKAIGGYQPLADLGKTYSSGAPILMGALGIGTPDQVAAAKSAFRTDPGYTFTRDQALDALNRRAGQGNMGQSGNADIASMNYASGLADQTFQNWIRNLQTTGQMGVGATGGAATGQAAGYRSLADLAQTYGQNQSGLYQNVAQGTIGANNLQAAGEAAGAKNLLNFGVNLASMAMGIPGGGSFLSNSFGSSPSYGSGNFFSGDAYGGSSSNPLKGLSPSDYGLGF